MDSALDLARLRGGQEHAGQNRDDGDDDQQFDECERRRPVRSLGWGMVHNN